ncbi:hypothetical protein ACFWA4_04625 [Streptomyces sp. NPDC060011]|uniref:hypothetical protein n=1 Tax=Streptomyces sp. NPDC060011 TaxID=3347037 RepID=UPI003697DAAF
MEALAMRYEPSPLEVNFHRLDGELPPPAREVVAAPPRTWARSRPVPLAMVQVFPEATGAAGTLASTTVSWYSPSVPLEHWNEH